MHSWARRLGSFEDVPQCYREFFDRLSAPDREPFPYTVLSPTFQGYPTPEIERLVTLIGGNFYVLERAKGCLITKCFPLADICLVENGRILLHSWITVCGRTSQGVLASSTLRFNSVTDHIMAPLIEAMRPQAGEGAARDNPLDEAQVDMLAGANAKFRNYARMTLRPGQPIALTIVQPEIRVDLLSLLGLSLSKSIAPAHLLVLTDAELIGIRDDDQQRWLGSSPHGGIWTYIPLAKIVSVVQRSSEPDLLILSIQLSGNVRFDAVFQDSKGGELGLLRRRLETKRQSSPKSRLALAGSTSI
jgi:hypothetical protein